jgi:hypothetical protein
MGTGYFKGRPCTGGIGQGKETKNLNVIDVLTYRHKHRNLKLAKATMRRGLGTNEEDWL